MLFTKSHEWACEREYRSIAELKIQDPATGFYYVDFEPSLQLREVIVGDRNITPVGQVAKLVRKSAHQVLLKARPAFKEFAIVRNKAVGAISVPARR